MKMPDPPPIVDTHQHLWDLGRFSLPWTKGDRVLGHNFLMADYLRATEGLQIAQSVYMEVDVDPAQQVAEAEYVTELCRHDDNPMSAAVISGRPSQAGFRDYILKFKENPYIKGVRQVLHGPSTPRGYCLDPEFVRGIQFLGERGLSFDLCLRSSELLDADKLVAQCPHTRFIVDHCGNMSVQETDDAKRRPWMDGMRHLSDHDHVVCKVSGIIASAAPEWTVEQLAPNIQFTLDTFGPDRVMFGGDWPVCTLRANYRRWVNALNEITREQPAAARRKLFHDNAVKFYGLSPSGKKWTAKSAAS
jgi:predicted TIM-barrel fold metal-dependent hydrolase